MKIKFMGAFIALLLHSVASYAQTGHSDAHITGHVVDKSNGEHIPFATVAIKGTTLGMATDATGHFLLKNAPLGEHTIIASFIGYEREELTVTVVPDKTIEVKFELIPQALDLSEVVVTGSRNETNRKESAIIVSVLSAKAFEATASTRVADALSFQPGLRVENTCRNDGVPQLRINGLSGQYTQILIDSRPVFSSLAGVYGLEQLPVGMVERIEVIRGGGSALYGSNAVAGVVNIITKEPLRNSFAISNNTGIFGKSLTDVNTTLNGSFVTDDHQTGVYMFAVANKRDAYDRDGDGLTEVPKLNSETLGFRAYHNLTAFSKLTVEYHHTREFRRGGNMLDKPPHEADIAEQSIHNINGGGLKYDLFSRDYKHRLNIYASAQGVEKESYNGTEQDLDAYGQTNDLTLVTGAQHSYSMDDFLFMPAQLTTGIEYVDNKLEDRMPAYDRYVKQDAKSVGGYVQNEWKNERFSFLLGGRLDKHSLMNKAVFSPRANTRYTFNDNITLRASYAYGYRAPQIEEEDLHIAMADGNAVLIVPAPDLKPEYSNSFNFSVDLYKRFDWAETNFLIDAFYTDIKDVFVLEERGADHDNNLILERTNASGAVVKGVNLELKLGITPKFIVDAGFTIQSSRYKEPYEWSSHVPAGKRMLRTPDQYGYITLNYIPVKNFTITATGNYTGSMLVPHLAGYIELDEEKRIPSFVDAGLRLAYDFQLSHQLRLQVNSGVKNIFDQFQKDIDKGTLRDSGYIYGPSMPRMIYLGIKLMM